MIVRNLKVHFRWGHADIKTQTFYDWFDFADWLKQETLNKREVIIIGWNYEEKRI